MNTYLIWLNAEWRHQSYPKATPPALLSIKHHLQMCCPQKSRETQQKPPAWLCQAASPLLQVCRKIHLHFLRCAEHATVTQQQSDSLSWTRHFGRAWAKGHTHVQTRGHQPTSKAICQNTVMLCSVACMTWGKSRAAGKEKLFKKYFLVWIFWFAKIRVFDGAMMASNQEPGVVVGTGGTKPPRTPAEVILASLRHEMFAYLGQTDCMSCH